jgi:hypothetical protein
MTNDLVIAYAVLGSGLLIVIALMVRDGIRLWSRKPTDKFCKDCTESIRETDRGGAG